jgi:hypothetical protein
VTRTYITHAAQIFLEGTEAVAFDACRFKYLGGIAYMQSGFNRAGAVTHSEFSYLGGSAVALWGCVRSCAPMNDSATSRLSRALRCLWDALSSIGAADLLAFCP